MTQRLFTHIMLMFLSPAWSLYTAFRTGSRSLRRWTLIVFITFYGSIITISGTNDGVDHLNNVSDHYMDLTLSQFLSEIWSAMTFKNTAGTEEDLYIQFVSYFTGGILGLPGLFFVFVSFVYAYFFVGSMFRVFSIFPRFKHSALFFGLAVVFILWKNIEGINTVRTWSGLWVLFYACISYYQTKQKKYLFLMFMPPLFHVGYFMMAIPAWIVLIVGVRKWIFAVIFFMSFISTILNPSTITRGLKETETGETMVDSYSKTEAKDFGRTFEITGKKNTAWHYRLYKAGLQDWVVVLVAITLMLFGTYFSKMTRLEASIFSIGLLTKALANTMWFLSAVANRSNVVVGVFILATLMLMWGRGYFNQKLQTVYYQKWILTFAMLVFVPFVYYRITDLLYYISAYMLAAPFIPWLDSELNISLRKAITKFLGF
ncbi:MAG: hypothetical protein WD077_08450 [Bacteroidia bacterium]